MLHVTMKVGICNGKATSTCINIVRYTMTQPTWEYLHQLNYALQGVYEQHHNWKLNFELNFMKKLNYKY